jgi:quinolinate synthase
MSRNDPPHLVAVLDLLRRDRVPEINLVLPGDMVDELSGFRERLDEAGQAEVREGARLALERMIEITEAAK